MRRRRHWRNLLLVSGTTREFQNPPPATKPLLRIRVTRSFEEHTWLPRMLARMRVIDRPARYISEQFRRRAVQKRSSEVVALGLIASNGLQPCQLICGLYTFCGGSSTHRVREIDHKLRDGQILSVVPESVDKYLVYLQFVHWKSLQRCQRRVARPEVIDRELYP